MCGIWLNIGSSMGEATLASMRHRGPDAEALRMFDVGGCRIELGHTRLSIIDLDQRANQPLGYRDDLWIVFNGEIYNHVELRHELAGLGHVFRTSSDTEVLLAAYAQWGTSMLRRLRGMFAFALLDLRDRRIVLARDPFGIKPLFVARRSGGLAAASEIQPLLACPGISRRARAGAVIAFLERGQSDVGAGTFFADIDTLPAAHFASIALDGTAPAIEPQRYWQPDYSSGLSDPVEAAKRVRERFVDSVRFHLRSDVPLGTMLSGGIDSSAIVGAVRKLLGDQAELHTFTFISPGDAIDESDYARLMSKVSSTVPHEIEAGPEEFVADVETLVRYQGEPFATTSIYAQYKVAQAARAAGIKVLLDGQGSDELFAGYRFYLGARLAGLIASGEMTRAAGLLRCMLRVPGVRFSSAMFHTLKALDVPGIGALAHHVERQSASADMIDPSWRKAHADPDFHVAPRSRRLALIDKLQASLERDVLPGLLRFEDRNTMAASIEARVPFLDVPLVETACSLSPELLVDDQANTKAVLRSALRGLVPDAILDRKDKIGFATPEARWLTSARNWAIAEMARAEQDCLPFLRLAAARATVAHCLANPRSYRPIAWRILNLVVWTRLYGVEHAEAGR
jgi:asparagine synthase (glutamine-hydrolysing)